jgi:hypothetical protein
LVDTVWCTQAPYKRFHALNCGLFLSKFVTFDGKYPKCPKSIKMYSINPIPGNPGLIFRESGNETIVGIPGNREREIPGMKH